MNRTEASESVAEKFTRVMNATPSRFGVVADVTTASAVTSGLLAIGLFGIRRSTDPSSLYVALAVAAIPLAVSVVFALALRSRGAVVSWLASLPFPVDNLNALLAGLGDTIEIVFAEGAELPTRAALQPVLDQVSDDILFLKERPDEHTVEIRLGVVDSKRMPLITNHQRWNRLVALVERVLVGLSKERPIARIRVV